MDPTGSRRREVNPDIELEHTNEMLRVGDLLVDRVKMPFQRPLNPTHVRKMAKEWNPELYTEIVVNVHEDDNLPYIIRGQHRRAAIIERFGEDEKISCRVYWGLDAIQEARIFVLEDITRKRATPAEQYLAGVQAGEFPFRELDLDFLATGWKVDPKAASHAPNTIGHVTPYVTIYRWKKGRYLREVLRAMRIAGWGKEGPPHGTLVKGIVNFLATYQKELQENPTFSLTSWLSDYPYREAYEDWLAISKLRGVRPTFDSATLSIQLRYNHNKKKYRLPEYVLNRPR